MKFFTGWVLAAGLVLVTAGAQAQMPAPYETGRSPYTSVTSVSDLYGPSGGPYAAVPPEVPGPRYGPTLLPPTEVYTVLRENGFSPLGIPRQRGFVYTISVIDRGGEDGRLIIDARNGRIIRFLPANRIGDNFNDDLSLNYGAPGPLPPMTQAPTRVRGEPRPPKPIPRVASRTVPVPKASPLAAKPAAAPEPVSNAAAEPVQQSAAAQPKSAEAQTLPPAAAPTVGQTKPVAPPLQPTQEMPAVQGLE